MFVGGHLPIQTRLSAVDRALIQEPKIPGSCPVRPHTYVSLSADSNRAVTGEKKHEVLVYALSSTLTLSELVQTEKTGPEDIELFPCSIQPSMKFFLLINVNI